MMPGKGIFGHREANDVIHTYVVLKKPIDWKPDVNFEDKDAALPYIAGQLGEGCAPELLALVTAGETKPVSRPIYDIPVARQWEHVPGVTLIGDTAHLTPPNGDGANWALYDGAELARAIAKSRDIEAATSRKIARPFYKQMRVAFVPPLHNIQGRFYRQVPR